MCSILLSPGGGARTTQRTFLPYNVSPRREKIREASWYRTAFAHATRYGAERLSPPPTRCYGLPHRVACARDDLLTHNRTFLPENLSPHGAKASVNRSMLMKRTVHDVTTLYAAETANGVLGDGNQIYPEISISCGQIAPPYRRDRHPVKRENIPDKRQRANACPSRPRDTALRACDS